jgi:hypothetical protein
MKRIVGKIKDAFRRVVNRLRGKVHAKIVKVNKHPKPKIAVEKSVEVSVGESKFYIPPRVEERRVYPEPRDLPLGYEQDRIILQVRDPWWIHAYWEVTGSTWERLRRESPADFARGFKKVLRVYDISHITFTGDNAHRFFDIEVTSEANNWYIDTQEPGRSWCVDLGLLFGDNRFITIVRSNTISTPLAGPSWITDEEWMIPEDIFTRLYGMGFGMGSSPLKLKKLWEKRLKGEFGSGALFSAASPVKKEKLKGFWLMVNTELIVYGQTQPDAKLTVGGRPVGLRPDGSFSLRFFLPDGKQVIPVEATSSDGEQVRSITPVVTKETK